MSNENKKQEYAIYDKDNNLVCTMVETHSFVEDWCKTLHYRAELVDTMDMQQQLKAISAKLTEVENCILELYLHRAVHGKGNPCKQLFLDKCISGNISYNQLSPELKDFIRQDLIDAGFGFMVYV